MQDIFPEGPPFTLKATMLDVDGNLVDYSTVMFSYNINRGTPITDTYVADQTGWFVIQRSSAGIYYVDCTSLGNSGKWQTGWRGLDSDGNIMAEIQRLITVTPLVPSTILF